MADPSTARDVRAVAAAYRRAARIVRDRSYPGLRRRWLTRRTVAAWLEWQAELAAQIAAELASQNAQEADRG